MEIKNFKVGLDELRRLQRKQAELGREGLTKFLYEKNPSERRAIRRIWRMAYSELPDAVKALPREQGYSVVACYAEELFLTLKYYPEMLIRGYLFLTSCNPEKPEEATGYRAVVVGREMPLFSYGHRSIEKVGGDERPLFVQIENLKTEHLSECLYHYRVFRRKIRRRKQKDSAKISARKQAGVRELAGSLS
jgi:hypothetical protein